jgi:serine/threonine protein kinase
MNDAPDRDVEVFSQALRRPAEERGGYLDHACAGDGELRLRVEALLRGHEKAGDFLEKPAMGKPTANSERTVAGEKPGDQVGRYKLLQQIGEGGCGVVFMADQVDSVRRLVALKVIKPGMDTKSVIARFEAERQALAMMDHPNIAHVFDASTTESGRPYFAMELVRGVKITDYCDQNSLTTSARLNLFIQVCGAVQHAHQKGIIHRDIKPSNILVTTSAEGNALPKIIDFGIAKATTGQRLTGKTLFTAFELMVGTPAYMSPEQAGLSSLDVDTRSDIYSLGVLLYELLTGTTPFDTRELLKAGLDEVRRAIRDEEPVLPSTRLSTMIAVDLASLAQYHHAEPPKLIRELRGDLDWIVIKALEKDRTRRYQTALGLAVDVQRYLADEVISARPPSGPYKFHKLVLRNKLFFSGLGIILLLLIIEVGVISRMWVREKQAHQLAEMEGLEASAGLFSSEGKLGEAERMYRQALAIRRTIGLPTTKVLEQLEMLLLDHDRFDDADALIKEILPSSDIGGSEYVDLFILRADLFARRGRWKEAARDAAKVVEYHPESHESYHMLAPLLVASGDLEGYQQLCRRIVARFGETSALAVADRMAKDCLILPSAGVDLKPVAVMAEVAVSKGASTPPAPFYQCCKALAEYRQGHFDGAAHWAELAAKNPFPYSQAEAEAILAMSQYQLKQVEKARIALAKGDTVVAEQLPKLGSHDLGYDWRDWIIVHALLTEAKGLIEGVAPSNNRSNIK